MIERSTKRFHFQSDSESSTAKIGEAVGRRIDRPMCICLVGSLGSGKSVLARGICRGLGVSDAVVSPSFILCEEYEGRLPVVHADLYRLDHDREVEELGLFDRMQRAVVLVEWGDRSAQVMAEAGAVMALGLTGDRTRSIDVECDGDYSGLFQGVDE